MKILWVNPSFLDYRVPVYKKLFELTNGDFFLIYSKKRVPDRVIRKIEDAIGDHAIGMSNEILLYFSGKDEYANTDYKLPYQPDLYKTISKVNADIIIGEGFFQWTPLALIYAKLNHKNFIIAYERTLHTERNCPKWRLLYRIFISKFVNGFIVNGQFTKEYLMHLGVNEQKIQVGSMSADSENLVKSIKSCSIKDEETLKSQFSKKNGLTYLYIGKINEPKGVIYLLNAWRQHIKIYEYDTLILVGTGPLYEKYLNIFMDCKSINFVGGIDYDKIFLYYSIADVFVMPTLEDNWSLVVPEAMACGLPIACSIYNGCYPELIDEGTNGKLFDPLKEETIIETLSYFHSIDLKLFGNKSINIENKYTADLVSQNIYKACEIF
jgi:glycosyltransferase involved in cell wall biosynthesis